MAVSDNFVNKRYGVEDVPVTISTGQSLSGAFPVFGKALVGIIGDSNSTGTMYSFQAAFLSSETFQDLHWNDSEMVMAQTAGAYLGIDPSPFYGARYLKIRNGTSTGASATSTTLTLRAILHDPI